VEQAARVQAKAPTRQRLIEAGLRMLLEHGYNHLGIQALLDETKVPKGSFYHGFRDKEDFALQVIDAYMGEVHQALDFCLSDASRPPLERIRAFFEMVALKYQGEGYLGCLLGGLGQELSGISELFRQKVEQCFSAISARISLCLREAQAAGQIPKDSDPERLADLLVDCWEGAALRCRLRRSPESLSAMLDFYFATLRPEPHSGGAVG
jgi:TetR/AcrR family transcriptional repressor of nem operon